ncbi:hypothetical protein Q1695_004976 [Nippostrongylus brasiliensis]|nr:hypothetical protein Q1695_004976 [Nippostrongylus brasiliensis]
MPRQRGLEGRGDQQQTGRRCWDELSATAAAAKPVIVCGVRGRCESLRSSRTVTHDDHDHQHKMPCEENDRDRFSNSSVRLLFHAARIYGDEKVTAVSREQYHNPIKPDVAQKVHPEILTEFEFFYIPFQPYGSPRAR